MIIFTFFARIVKPYLMKGILDFLFMFFPRLQEYTGQEEQQTVIKQQQQQVQQTGGSQATPSQPDSGSPGDKKSSVCTTL